MANFSGSGHSIFRASSAFEREENYEAKEEARSQYTYMVVMKTSSCFSALSIHGAKADLCNEVPKDIEASGKLAAPDHLEKMEIPTDLHCRKFYQCTATEKPGARIRVKIRTIVRKPEFTQTVF